MIPSHRPGSRQLSQHMLFHVFVSLRPDAAQLCLVHAPQHLGDTTQRQCGARRVGCRGRSLALQVAAHFLKWHRTMRSSHISCSCSSRSSSHLRISCAPPVRKSTSEFGAPKYSDLGRISTDFARFWTKRELQAHARRPSRNRCRKGSYRRTLKPR